MVSEYALIIGIIMITLAVLVFVRRKHIWTRYIENYRPKSLPILDFLYRPYQFVYYANAYFVCPVFLLFGIYFVYISQL